MSVSVLYPNNQLTIILDVTMSNGTSGALPSDTTITSSSTAVLASWLNMGIRQAWVRPASSVPQGGSVTATITAASASTGQSASFDVTFVGQPAVTVASFSWNEAGSTASVG